QDKFGPLGKIVVMSGRQDGSRLLVEHWVMSCRAFSRRIEHGCLLYLFRKFDVKEANFDLVATPRNGPVQSFFLELMGAAAPRNFSISAQRFVDNCPRVYLQIREDPDE
ncbi:MAG: hypothetical protein WB621_08310, partial [Candidatus Acidiferrales bacterium]